MLPADAYGVFSFVASVAAARDGGPIYAVTGRPPQHVETKAEIAAVPALMICTRYTSQRSAVEGRTVKLQIIVRKR